MSRSGLSVFKYIENIGLNLPPHLLLPHMWA